MTRWFPLGFHAIGSFLIGSHVHLQPFLHGVQSIQSPIQTLEIAAQLVQTPRKPRISATHSVLSSKTRQSKHALVLHSEEKLTVFALSLVLKSNLQSLCLEL